jgi:hypothetical protein
LTLDEAARFEYDEFGKSKADNIWSNVGRGTSTFGESGKKLAISSAWEEGDYIEKLYELSEQDTSTLAFRLKTWDVNLNPNMSEAVLKASEDYIKDPITAALEYENIRSSKINRYLNADNVSRAFIAHSRADIVEYPMDVTNEHGDTRYYVGCNILRSEAIENNISFAHIDYGVKKDRAAMAIASIIQLEDTWGISVDILAGWKPYISKDKNNKAIHRVVSFLNVEEILIELCRLRNVRIASFDCYNSQHTIQNLHNQGITTVEMKVSNKAQLEYFSLSKNLINEGRLLLPKDSNLSTTLKTELVNLTQNPITGRIDHTKTSTKDISDSVVNAVYNCYHYAVKNNLISGGVSTALTSISSSKTNLYNAKENKIIKLKSGKAKLRRNINRM